MYTTGTLLFATLGLLLLKNSRSLNIKLFQVFRIYARRHISPCGAQKNNNAKQMCVTVPIRTIGCAITLATGYLHVI